MQVVVNYAGNKTAAEEVAHKVSGMDVAAGPAAACLIQI